jgi:hypothetical protein
VDNENNAAEEGRQMPEQRTPTPEQIRAYLSSHGWAPEDPMPEDLVIFTYKEPADDGQPITVYVPCSVEETPRYPLRVRDVVVTAAGMEDRAEADVLADMLATPASSAGAA